MEFGVARRAQTRLIESIFDLHTREWNERGGPGMVEETDRAPSCVLWLSSSLNLTGSACFIFCLSGDRWPASTQLSTVKLPTVICPASIPNMRSSA